MPNEGDWELRFDARRPIPEVVAGKLEELIDNGRLPRGEALPNENELARRFGVSRSSVRTALQTLQHRGLVEVIRGRGWSTTIGASTASLDPGDPLLQTRRRPAVTDLDQYRLTQIFEARQAVESAASGLAAMAATDSDLADIEAAHYAHVDSPDDLDSLLQTDEAFHAAVFAAAGDAALIAAIAPLLPVVRDFRRDCFTFSGSGASTSALGHGLVLAAIKNGDSSAAKQAMTAHLLMFTARLGSSLPRVTARPDRR